MTKARSVSVMLLAVCLLLGSACGQDSPPDAAADREVVRIEIPLNEGRLELRDLLRGMCEAADLEAPPEIDRITWSIHVQSILGSSQIETIRRATDETVDIEVGTDRVIVSFDPNRVESTLSETREQVRQALTDIARVIGAVQPGDRSFGITFVTDEDEFTPLPLYVRSGAEPRKRLVMLVHGLDDPGWMWRDVIPALRKAGYDVARFEYPNDGPISDAADLFAWHLMELKAVGISELDVVAHSMGGLVSRDVLTRRAYYAGDGSGGSRFPSIDRLILCGTPNHGSKMVRLRAVSEIKEQISRAISGQGELSGGLDDGSGEAAVDLMPDSDFLRRLNVRPMPSHTRFTIVAGRMSPITADELTSLTGRIRKAAESTRAPEWLRSWLASADAETSDLIDEAVRGLGDGCVTLDSARLEGVDDFVTVEANHVSMIVNVLNSPKTVPPAIPIVLDRLADEE